MSFLLSETHWEVCKQQGSEGETKAGPQFLRPWSLGTESSSYKEAIVCKLCVSTSVPKQA